MLTSCVPALVAPTARATGRASLLGWLAVIAAPLLVAAARDQHDLSGAMRFAALAGGAAGGFALHDPSPGLAATGVPRSVRRVVAGALVAAAVLVCWLALGLVVLVTGSTVAPLSGLLPEVFAAACLSVAVGSRAEHRSGTVGVSSGMATVLLMATSTGLATAHPALSWLPVVGVESHGWRWWGVAVIAALVASIELADPARRRPLARSPA